ncbi:hypothetical protein [Bacillus sp. NPDC094106]|uniref:hypothetical protein n=1 Tax=Bacillus sp. NPDC094106 TaxID=3363949 RepID=UPI003824D7B8
MKEMVLIDINASEVAKYNRYIQLTTKGIKTTANKKKATTFTKDKADVFILCNKNLRAEEL